jgi:Flp pilus assembly protein TadG
MTTRSTDKGGVAVEFALLTPLLLVFLFGVFEFGLMMYDKVMITDASREGARLAVTYRNPKSSYSDVKTRVLQYCGANLLVSFSTAATPTVMVSYNGATPSSASDSLNSDPAIASGKTVAITVNYDYYTFVIGRLLSLVAPGSSFGNPIRLSATTTMVNE